MDFFKYKYIYHINNPTDKKLNCGKLYAVNLGRKVVDNQNVKSKNECTDKNQDISFVYGKAFVDAH